MATFSPSFPPAIFQLPASAQLVTRVAQNLFVSLLSQAGASLRRVNPLYRNVSATSEVCKKKPAFFFFFLNAGLVV